MVSKIKCWNPLGQGWGSGLNRIGGGGRRGYLLFPKGLFFYCLALDLENVPQLIIGTESGKFRAFSVPRNLSFNSHAFNASDSEAGW